MEHRDAIELIRDGISGQFRETWVDIGAGQGVFTRALADCLHHGGTIYAVDRDKRSLNAIPDEYNGVGIVKMAGDVNAVTIPGNLDGIILANTLHFIADQNALLQKLTTLLNPSGVILIVEYDTRESSRWIPYPVPYVSLPLLAKKIDFTTRKLAEQPSVYGNGNMYSAVIKRLNSV